MEIQSNMEIDSDSLLDPRNAWLSILTRGVSKAEQSELDA